MYSVSVKKIDTHDVKAKAKGYSQVFQQVLDVDTAVQSK